MSAKRQNRSYQPKSDIDAPKFARIRSGAALLHLAWFGTLGYAFDRRAIACARDRSANCCAQITANACNGTLPKLSELTRKRVLFSARMGLGAISGEQIDLPSFEDRRVRSDNSSKQERLRLAGWAPTDKWPHPMVGLNLRELIPA